MQTLPIGELPPQRRHRLDAGWQLHACAPGAVTTPEAAAALDWPAPVARGTAAAMLRAAGQWSLDGAPLRFDGTDWWFRLVFDCPPDLDPARARLRFDGLATLAQAWLNGTPLLESDDMHIAWLAQPAERLRGTGNELLIRCASLDAALAVRRARPRWRTPMVDHPQLRWFRTTLMGRTPGWTPPCAPVGPWREVWIEQPDAVQVRVRTLTADLDGDTGHPRGHLRLACDLEAAVEVHEAWLMLDHAGQAMRVPLRRAPDAGAQAWDAALDVPAVQAWWPHTHGEPALHPATLAITLADGTQRIHSLGRVGFRRIALDTTGEGFRLSVNGVPVFCRGASWMPLDPVTLTADARAVGRALAQARAAGLNMLRLSGTMVYEDDAFLAACDAAGVLLWQDLMFASMDYPGEDAAFAATAEREVRQQLARLQGHPCVAVVCGNSEVGQQAAMSGAPRASWTPALFHERFAALADEALPGLPYWPSSTAGGAYPHQVDAGTSSAYDVSAYLQPVHWLRRANLRFATECLAFGNLPDAAAIGRMPGGDAIRATYPQWKQRTPRVLGCGWDFDDVRDHYLGQLSGVDPTMLRVTDHERYLKLGRAATGELMRLAFAEWRRPGSECGGALIWFLRDLWAGPGLGLLDETGAPKPCWPMLARALQPLAVLVTDEGNSGLRANLINERATPVRGVLRLAAWRGATALAQGETPVTVPARGAATVDLAALLDPWLDLNGAFRFAPVMHDAVSVALVDDAGRERAIDWWFPRGAALAPDPELGLAGRAERLAEDRIAIEVSTRRLATGVHVDAPGWTADDDWFALAPGATRRILLQRRAGPPPRAWRCTLDAINAASPAWVGAPA